jgi:hypothetical protein
VTESSNAQKPSRVPKAAAKATSPARARSSAPAKAIVAKPKGTKVPATPRHPNLGLAPLDMTSGYAAAAEKLRGGATSISAGALEAAVVADPTIRARYDEVGLRRLLRDGELLVERLAMCLGSGDTRRLTDYAEWIVPIYRRRGVPLMDLSAICAGIRETVEPLLGPDEIEAATRSLDAARAVFKRNSRVAGDRRKRNALWKWMYRGV